MKVFERVVVEINHKSSTCGAEQEGVGYSTDKITKRDKWKGAGINKNSMSTGVYPGVQVMTKFYTLKRIQIDRYRRSNLPLPHEQ